MYESNEYPPVHPGEVLFDHFLLPMGISCRALSKAVKVSTPRITQIVSARHGISADTALRLARYFGNSPSFWLQLQARYELDVAMGEAGEAIAEIRPLEEAGRR